MRALADGLFEDSARFPTGTCSVLEPVDDLATLGLLSTADRIFA
jgi:hypothetical protein